MRVMNHFRDYSPHELRRRTGSTDQLARVTASALCEGREKGVQILEFHTGSGFNFTVVPDRGMDIAFADYRGFNLSWISPTGIAHPSYYEPRDWGWIRGFFGGLLTTCGLVNVGTPDQYKGEHLGAHGRVSHLPATAVSHEAMWVGDELYLAARGEVRETRPNHYDLILRRSIRVRAGERALRLHDTVINAGFEKTPHQILYHVNAGFPLLSASSRLLSPTRAVTPRDAVAHENKEHYRECQDPTPGFQEQVFFHDMQPCSDGRVWVALSNPHAGDGGLALYIKYDPKVLPFMVQWKMMGEGMYVMGMEPSNTYGIDLERAQALRRLTHLEPGEHIDYNLEIGILDGADEIEAFTKEVSNVSPVEPDYASVVL